MAAATAGMDLQEKMGLAQDWGPSHQILKITQVYKYPKMGVGQFEHV